ncbi:MAG TPA: hypothetical protein VF228_14850 [Iamia sp.]
MTTRTTASTSAVDRFLDAITGGAGIPVDLYATGAHLDATVPGWRLGLDGPEAITAEYGRWFAAPGRFEELDRSPVADGEVVTYLLTWVEDGVPHAAHHCHQLRLDESGRIVSDTVFCGGRWDAALLAQMAEEG